MELLEYRALMYKYLAHLLDYLYDRDIEEIDSYLNDLMHIAGRLEGLRREYRGLLELAREFASEMKAEIEKYGRDLFQAEYVSTFELGVRGPLCPPYESEYVKPDRVESVEFGIPGQVKSPSVLALESKLEVVSRVAAFYRSYGVLARDVIPDHAVAELEFMYYLVYKEYSHLRENRVEEAAKYREAQVKFISEHLSRWLGKLEECVSEKSPLKSYAKLLRLINTFLSIERKLLKPTD